jgi:hypothetical protein
MWILNTTKNKKFKIMKEKKDETKKLFNLNKIILWHRANRASPGWGQIVE